MAHATDKRTEAAPAPPDPMALLRSKSYVVILVVCAVLGVPIAMISYLFLQLVDRLQTWVYTDLPNGLGFHGEPTWWPLLPLLVAGVVVGLVVRYVPGRGGHSPADGFKTGGAPFTPVEMVGVAIAAISTLLGSPLIGAFLLMETAGLGGPMLGVILLPGLLAAGIGTLIFVGMNSLTGFGPVSLSIPNLPPFLRPDSAEFGWALVVGVAAAVVGTAIRWLALTIRPHVERRSLVLTPVAGLIVAALAIGYAEATDKSSADVLFSGQSGLGPLLLNAAQYSSGALLLLLVCKGVAYSVCLSAFRGGPVFPALFVGATGGILLSHLPGLPLVAGAAMGIGAMSVVILRLPLTSVLLATLLLQSDGLAVIPLVIVAVVVAHVLAAHLAVSPPMARLGIDAPPATAHAGGG